MHLTGLVVRNYRSLEAVNIAFRTGLNVLVGKNNAGKSNIVEALAALLGEKWPTYLEFEHKHFYRADMASDPEDKLLLAVRLAGGVYNRKLIVEQNIKACVKEVSDFPRWDNFEEIEDLCDGKGSWPSGEALAGLLDTATYIWFFLLVPRDEKRKERCFGARIVSTDPVTRKTYQYVVQRFPQQFREALLTTARIPAFRDPAKELKVTSYSWYGKLVKGLYEAKSAEQSKLLETAQNTFTTVYGEVFAGATKELCETLAEAIFHHSLSFHAGPFTMDESHKNITIFVNDGVNSPYYEKGSGIQSALVMALFAYYCSQIHQGGSLLLVEEPELFLHPHARRSIEGQLVKFANSGDTQRTRQVIMATHATEFVRSADPGGLILAKKVPGETATTVKQVNPNSLDADAKKRWKQIVSTKNSEIFFGDHAILVEGGEEHLLAPIADLNFGIIRWLDGKNVSIARVDGKMQFSTYSSILSSYGIRHTILTDLDFLRRGASAFVDRLTQSERKDFDALQLKLHSALSAPKAKDVKAAINDGNYDWLSFYQKADQLILDLQEQTSVEDEQIEEVAQMWAHVKQRMLRPRIQVLAKDDQVLADLILKVTTAFRQHDIFVLRTGELEDYYSDDLKKVLAGEPSKDRRAAVLGDLLRDCSKMEECSQWLDADEFVELLKAVDASLQPTASEEPSVT